MKMCQAFSGLGHEVTLLVPCLAGSHEFSTEDDFSFYGVSRSFAIERITVPDIRGWSYIYGFRAARAVQRLQADIVYGRSLPACTASLLAGMPAYFEAHVPVEDSGVINRTVFQRYIARRDYKGMVVISNALKTHYIDRYSLNPDSILVAHDGADMTDSEGPGDKRNMAANRLQVGYIGHLYAGKGMEIIAQLARQCDWADFHVIGGLDRDIDHWLRELTDCGNIRFYGFLPPNEAARHRSMFDVVLA
ncbi:MAG TPA: glycosyltransferase, partial [Gammaproteobacteria bacterium]